MDLPFTHDQFLDLFGDYNRALWPAFVFLWAATAFAIIRLYRGAANSSRILSGLLALHWAWSGAVYHFWYFRRINPAAVLFGAIFLIQAGMFAWRGFAPPTLSFDPRRSRWRVAAAGLILYSLAYPALGLAFGLAAPRVPSFGVPCPTTVLTAGLLLLAPRREARVLGAIPVLWAGVGGSAAFLLAIRADVILPLAGLILLAFMVTGNRRQRGEP